MFHKNPNEIQLKWWLRDVCRFRISYGDTHNTHKSCSIERTSGIDGQIEKWHGGFSAVVIDLLHKIRCNVFNLMQFMSEKRGKKSEKCVSVRPNNSQNEMLVHLNKIKFRNKINSCG